MSGHSKWSTIKRQKGVADARRSAVFTKHARLIAVAAREGGKDPAMNFRLRLAIDRARTVNMPNDNIDRAIKAGTGESKGSQMKEVVYEGFGPGGIALIVPAVTDNPNRTSAEIRMIFSKAGGSLGGQNSVSWMFTLRGAIHLPASALPPADRLDELTLAAIDAGAEDVQVHPEEMVLYVAPEKLAALLAWLDTRGLQADESGIEYVPQTTTSATGRDEERLHEMMSALDDQDDVTGVFSNAA